MKALSGYLTKYSLIIYKIMYMCLLMFGILFSMHNYMGIEDVTRLHVMVMFAAIIYIVFLSLVSKMVRLAVVASTVVATLFIGINHGVKESISMATSRSDILWILGLTILIYILLSLWVRYDAVKCGVLIVCSLYFFALIYTQQMIDRIGIISLVTIILMLLSETINSYKKKKEGTPFSGTFSVSLLPIFIIFAFLLFFAKEDERPYDWKYVKQIYNITKDELRNIMDSVSGNHRDDFVYSMTGYGDSDRIGAKAADGNRELLVITGDKIMPCNFYLAGSYKDTFDGKEWSESKKIAREETDKNRKIDALETLYAIDNYDKKMYSSLIVKNHLKTEYRYFNTAKNFTASKAIYKGEKLKKKKVYGDELESTCFQIYAGKEAICDLISGKKEDSEYLWNNTCRKYLADDVSFKDYLEYKEKIKSNYGETFVLCEDIQKWKDSVTYGAKSREEKLFMIQDELRKLTYTKETDARLNEMKDGNEFLEYFLLDRKEGYCTYFATAFVLLARSEGLPARYVQGFYVPLTGKYEAIVKPRMAHAWAEVYFEGIGWIPFENTPSYEGVAYTNVDYSMASMGIKESGAEEEAEDSNELEDFEDEKASDFEEIGEIIKIFVCAVFCLAAIILLVNIILKRAFYKKLSLRDKFIFNVKKNLYLLEKLGLRIENGETLSEFNVRIQDEFLRLEREKLSFILEYEEVIYSNKNVTETMLALVCNEQAKMIKYVRVLTRLKFVFGL